MSRPPLADWLQAAGAHHDVVSWAGAYGDDWQRAWAECPRGDWLLGLAARFDVERPALVRAACACARLALDQVPDGERRAAEAIEAAERWAAQGGPTDACDRAANAAEAAAEQAPDPAASNAALAASAAARSATDPDVAAVSAASAAQAAMLDAGDCAMMQALAWAQSECAKRVREQVPAPAG